MNHTINPPGGKTLPSDPTLADAFDIALTTVAAKYDSGIPLSRGELLRLARAALALIGTDAIADARPAGRPNRMVEFCCDQFAIGAGK